jgi:hypothetical protein
MARLSAADSRPRKALHLLAAFAVGAALGFAGYLLGRHLGATAAFDDATWPRWADLLAGLLGLLMLATAGAMAAMSLSPTVVGRVLKLEGPAGADELRDARLQALILGLSGVIVILPPLLAAQGLDPLWALALLALLLALHTALNLFLYRRVDELFRRTVVEAGALTFWLGQGVLFLWAVAERLGVAPALTGWDIYVVLLAAYLVASAGVAARRGLA